MVFLSSLPPSLSPLLSFHPHFFSVGEQHRRCAQIKADVCAAGYEPRQFFVLLLNTAQFEFLLKEVRRETKPHTHV